MPVKIVLWGWGTEYNAHINILKDWERNGCIKIIGVTATTLPPHFSIDGWKTIKASDIVKVGMDYLVVMSTRFEREISNEAVRYGIPRQMIIPCRVMDIPYFSWGKYKEIRDGNISIISNNCFGGLICHTLGIECRSPFKNMSIDAGDLIDIFLDLQTYMSYDPIFKEWRKDPHSQKRNPVFLLGQKELFFNHSDTIEEGIRDWNRRKSKINYKNLMLVIYTDSLDIAMRFRSVPCRKKICFVPREMGIMDEKDGIWMLDVFPGQIEFWETVNSNATISTNAINYKLLSLFSERLEYRMDVSL